MTSPEVSIFWVRWFCAVMTFVSTVATTVPRLRANDWIRFVRHGAAFTPFAGERQQAFRAILRGILLNVPQTLIIYGTWFDLAVIGSVGGSVGPMVKARKQRG
jgi:hypothetical protein